jgi:hypothetical protein
MPSEVVRFTEGGMRNATWELPAAGCADGAAHVDVLLAHAIRGIAAEYIGEPVEWSEVNDWPDSGRLIVFPSAKRGPEPKVLVNS